MLCMAMLAGSGCAGRQTLYDITTFGAKGDSVTVNTPFIQAAIDQCAADGGGTVLVPAGCFSSGALFLKTNVTLRLAHDARLRAVAGLANYPMLDSTRIAGIEMRWPSAFINAINTRNVRIEGEGTIDGSGYYWWDLYWNKRDSLLQKSVPGDVIDWYVPRPRLILFQKADHASLAGVTLRNAAFWTVHICYSNTIAVTGVSIRNPVLEKGKKAASSDGIDVDSSYDITIQDCSIACDDDCIAIKSGRGSDGLRVNIPTDNVRITRCRFGSGHGGVSIGTETAGGIRNVYVSQCEADSNEAPIKFKPRPGRGGVIENIVHDGWTIRRAGTAIEYSLREVTGEDYVDEWQHIRVPFAKATPRYRNITLRNIRATDGGGSIRFLAWPLAHAENVILENVNIHAIAGARFQYIDNLLLQNVTVTPANGEPVEFKEVTNLTKR